MKLFFITSELIQKVGQQTPCVALYSPMVYWIINIYIYNNIEQYSIHISFTACSLFPSSRWFQSYCVWLQTKLSEVHLDIDELSFMESSFEIFSSNRKIDKSLREENLYVAFNRKELKVSLEVIGFHFWNEMHFIHIAPLKCLFDCRECHWTPGSYDFYSYAYSYNDLWQVVIFFPSRVSRILCLKKES